MANLGSPVNQVFPARARALASVSPSLPGKLAAGLRLRPVAILCHAAIPPGPAGFCPLLSPLRHTRMGGLCQATLRWSTTGSGLRGPLHPSRGHFQQPLAGPGKRLRHFSLEGLPSFLSAQNHDSDRRRIPTAFLTPRAPRRVAANSLLRIPGESLPGTETNSLSSTPGHGRSTRNCGGSSSLSRPLFATQGFLFAGIPQL